MAKISGTALLLKIGNETIGGTSNATLSIERDLPDATTKDDGAWASHIAGLGSWSISFDGMADPSAEYGVRELMAVIVDQCQDITVQLIFDAAACNQSLAGQILWEGKASIGSLEITAENNEPIGFSGEATGNGAPTVTWADESS